MISESVRAHGHFYRVIERPAEDRRMQHNALLFAGLQAQEDGDLDEAERLLQQAASIRRENEASWTRDDFHNVVTDEGARYALDKTFEASAYTATWYMGLIAGTGYTALLAADTAAQINGTNGWDEAGGATSPTYTGNRKTVAWNAASSRSKSSTTTVFTFTNGTSATMKGVFLVTTNTKDGTTGTMYSVGLSTGGDDVVKSGDVANVTWTGSL